MSLFFADSAEEAGPLRAADSQLQVREDQRDPLRHANKVRSTKTVQRVHYPFPDRLVHVITADL